MLNRRGFLKLSPLAGCLFLPALPGSSGRLRVLIPANVAWTPLADAASSSGLEICSTYYSPSRQAPITSLGFDLVSLPIRAIPEWITTGSVRSLPDALTAALDSLGNSGRRPHDPENRYSLPHEWGCVEERLEQILLWANDWVIPVGASPLAERFLRAWLAAEFSLRPRIMRRVQGPRYRLAGGVW